MLQQLNVVGDSVQTNPHLC